MRIKDLRIGEGLHDGLHCFITSIAERETKTGKPFLQVVLKDETGETKVNVWDQTRETWEYDINDVVCLTGSVGEFNGKAQLDISSWRSSEKALSDFTRQSDRDIEDMFAELKECHLDQFEKPFLKFCIEKMILGKPQEMFKKAPAAKGMHHPWIGGLLEHVLGLCNLADAIYQSHYYLYFPKLDMELVKFGLIFHDWGKIYEYDYNTPNLQISERGALQHHMSIAFEYVVRCSVMYEDTLDLNLLEDHRNLLVKMQHIIFTHHGKPEWQALGFPAMPEAFFVHWLDNFDAQVMNMRESLQKGPNGDVPGFTEKNWAHGTAYLHQDVTTGGNNEF